MAIYCVRCGSPIQEDDVVCPSCGNPVPAASPGYNSWNSPESGEYGDTAEQTQNVQVNFPWNEYLKPQPTMKWFKFIIWVQLFVSALYNIYTGIVILADGQYGQSTYIVYAIYGGLKIVDMFYGLLCLVLAVAAIYVRFQLSGFRRRGPKLYMMFLLANIVLSVLYIIALSLIVGNIVADMNTVVSLCISVVFLLINKVYFRKRRHMFIN